MRRLSALPFRSSLKSLQARRGVFLVVSAVCLAAVMAFIAFSVDLGIVTLTKTKMQSATDAAALAAAMEITNAISTAGPDVQNVFDYALAQARQKAASVASLNGVYVNANQDVTFGCRYQSGNAYVIDWKSGGNQINVVKVTARRNGTTKGAPDAKVPGLFSSAFGSQGTAVKTESISYIEPRDIVVVHDFSRSMNFDSYFTDEQNNSLSKAQIEANLKLVWDDLQPLNLGNLAFEPQYAWQTKSNTGANATVTFKGTSVTVSTNTAIKAVTVYFSSGSQSFSISNETTKTGTWAGTGSNAGKRITKVDVDIRQVGSTKKNWSLTGYAYNKTTISDCFGLTNLPYPYAAGSWSAYIDYVQTASVLATYGYQDMYGGKTWLNYTLRHNASQFETKDLWKTRHYPFHAIKEGHEMLCDFLKNLGFDDHLGMVSYDSSHRIETKITDNNPDFPAVDISSKPLTNDYEAIRKLMHYKQAAHYSDATNMAGGMKDAIALLDQHKRTGSRPAIILMTDGVGNTLDPGETGILPIGWSWNSLFDYNGDGVADFSTDNNSARATLKYVKQAVDKGYTVHAVSVGVDADRKLLKAIAWLGNGQYIDVPGGKSAVDVEADLKLAFNKIAAAVPPARLVKGD